MRIAEPFRSYSTYLKEKYGESVYRVSIDAGFSCPNRGKDRSRPGCSYCDEHGSRAPYLSAPGSGGDFPAIQEQIDRAIKFLKARYGAESYILYFQAFSSTYAPVPFLKKTYDFALSCAPFKEMIVSTRPDCIPPETVDLLKSYKRADRDIWVELGLQSASNQTLKRINRGHTVEVFTQAYKTIRKAGLKLTVHLIFGLPGEGEAEILNTVRFVSELSPDGIKIHNLHIPTGCPMFHEYQSGCLSVPCSGRHLSYTLKALELLPPHTVIMRLTCDTPLSRCAAPRVFLPKAQFYEQLRKAMKEAGTRQGKKYTGGLTT